MIQTKFIYVLVTVVGYLLITSCSQDDHIYNSDNTQTVPDFVAVTRDGDVEERTYRVFAFGSSTGVVNCSPTSYVSGSYKGMVGVSMTPCKLNDDGSIDTNATEEENMNCLLKILDGSGRYCIFISPGIKLVDGACKIRASEADVLFSNVEQLYSPGLKLGLSERRARIIFNLKIGEGNSTVRDLDLDEIIIHGTSDPDSLMRYMPQVKQVDNAELSTSVKMTDCSPVDKPKSCYISSEPLYLLSGYYAPKEILNSKKYGFTGNVSRLYDSQYLSAHIKMKIGGRGELDLTQVLTREIIEIKPLHEYTFNFVVNTEFINVTLDVCDCSQHPQAWQQENTEDGDQVIGPLGDKVTIDLGKWKIGDDNGWIPAISEDQVI